MNSCKPKVKKFKKKHEKKHKKKVKKRRSSSSSDSSSSSSTSCSSSSSSDKHRRKKLKKRHKKDCKDNRLPTPYAASTSSKPTAPPPEEDFSIPIHLMDSSHKKPETREEYEKRQSVIRKVVDPETSRTRLIKGDGEILEEIVSRDRHLEINRQATQTDGQVYQNKTIGWAINSDKK